MAAPLLRHLLRANVIARCSLLGFSPQTNNNSTYFYSECCLMMFAKYLQEEFQIKMILKLIDSKKK